MTDDLIERVARIIDPSSWRVMDSYLEQTKRKYAGQNVGWPSDQFQHKESMAKAREIVAAIDLPAQRSDAIAAWNTRADDARIRELEAENERLLARLAHAEDDCEDDCIYCEERRQEIARAALEASDGD